MHALWQKQDIADIIAACWVGLSEAKHANCAQLTIAGHLFDMSRFVMLVWGGLVQQVEE